jgi:Ca2+-binding EF-hand superfamily protein
MFRQTKIVSVIIVIAMLVATGATLEAAVAQTKQDKLALAEGEVKQLLLLMDTNENGKISKEEWMRFMEAEVERLDKVKNGELDVKELAQSKLRVSYFISMGK